MDYLQSLFTADFGHTLVRFLICMIVNLTVITQLYYKKSRRRDFLFTFVLMSVAIFFLVFFMMSIERGKATMGVGLGLFGIFSIMRYRTDAMPVREMTYLFLIICLSVVHAMAEVYLELAMVDALILLTVWLCEQNTKIQNTKLIQYDRIELIKPEKRDELTADLESRTGLKILKVEVGGIDFLKDTAVLRITYEGSTGSADIDGQFKVKKSQWRTVGVILLLFGLTHVPAVAQSNDFGMWYEVGAEKKLSNKWSLGADAEFRMRDNMKTSDRWSAGLSAEYKIVKGLKASAGYSLLYDNNPEEMTYNRSGNLKKWTPSYWGTRHRFNVSLTGSADWNRFTFSLRERWQYTYRPEVANKKYVYSYDDDDDQPSSYTMQSVKSKGKNLLRSRFQMSYNIPNSKVVPFANVELYNDNDGIQKVRYQVGTDYKINKKNVLSLTYRYQHVGHAADDNDVNSHLLGLSYKIKF